MIRVGIVGLGYWGPNLARNFSDLKNSEVTVCCDINNERLNQVSANFPNATKTTKFKEALNKKMLDAVVISTPTKTHYSLAKQSLEQGLHTFIEKPLATSSKECEDLILLAKKHGVILFVGHVFLYTAAVIQMKELIESGDLGNICYISSRRLNLGPVRQDVNALWDLASHDTSIILFLMASMPSSVNCQGLAYLNKNIHDVCTLTLNFEDRCMAMVHTSWLDPNKIRQMTVVGDKKMVVYNDLDQEKIKIYDKRIEAPLYSTTFGEFQYSYRYGDSYSPRLTETEPLKTECQHFIECIEQGKIPVTDGQNGLEVVRVLEAADYSLFNGGGRVQLRSLS